jgi:hypothetical protein
MQKFRQKIVAYIDVFKNGKHHYFMLLCYVKHFLGSTFRKSSRVIILQICNREYEGIEAKTNLNKKLFPKFKKILR